MIEATFYNIILMTINGYFKIPNPYKLSLGWVSDPYYQLNFNIL